MVLGAMESHVEHGWMKSKFECDSTCQMDVIVNESRRDDHDK